MPKVSRVEVFKVNIPFKISFAHALKKRRMSESIFVKVILENGITGFGESLPRGYVTGNSQDSVFKELSVYAKRVIGLDFKDSKEGANIIKSLDGIEGEGRCAIEIALLDSLGKVCSKPVWNLLGESVNTRFVYSFVISGESLFKAGLMSLFARTQGYEFIKVKVGSKNDVAKVKLSRQILPDADIRVDANGAWDAATALEIIERLRPFKISCVEQPTPGCSYDAMREIAEFCPEPIIADESLCTRDDALTLAHVKACDIFNVRLSKCGGISRSLEIIEIGSSYRVGCQLGCHVGESGILSAAQRHLAGVVKNVRYMEGSYSRMLLKEDIIEEDLTPRKGIGYPLNGAGLGVTVREDILRKYTQENILI